MGLEPAPPQRQDHGMTDASPWGRRPVADQTIDSRVAEYLRRQGMDRLATRVARLHGDASNRCYVRLTPRDGPSMVLAVHPEPFATDALPEITVGALFERLDPGDPGRAE